MTFSERLWAAGAGSYAQIVTHPFLTGLADGSLPRESFRYYVVQDSHYLRGYARALALTASRAPDDQAVAMFAAHAAHAIAVEQDLHVRLLGELGIAADAVRTTPVGPTTTAYTSYLTAVCATGTYAEAVAAVLPCYWVYRDIGRTLLAASSPDPVYAAWIATYGGEAFDQVVTEVLAATDALGRDVGDAELERCERHFGATTRYEWMFWDAAYHELAWPV